MNGVTEPDHIASRNRLVEKHLYVVHQVANRIHTRLPVEVQLDDLVSAGVFGLMDAIERFDATRGNKLATFAQQRIYGAIIDELRKMDHVSRRRREQSEKLTRATTRLTIDLDRAPTEEELAEHLRMSPERFRSFAVSAASVSLISLSRKLFVNQSGRDLHEADAMEDRLSVDPAESARRRDIEQTITCGLDRAERSIVVLYYFQDMTMKRIGQSLGFSESRVSQMHSQIIKRLRARFGESELRSLLIGDERQCAA